MGKEGGGGEGGGMSKEDMDRVNDLLSRRGMGTDNSAAFYESFDGQGVGEVGVGGDKGLADMTHIASDGAGNTTFKMVDTSPKSSTPRIATAEAKVLLPEAVNDVFLTGGGRTAKGNVFDVSRLAGIMGAKRTSDLIPLCHNIYLDKVDVKVTYVQEVGTVLIKCTSVTVGKTGVEMEALTGASVAALALIDMVKGISPEVTYTVRLLEKEGGKRLVRDGKVVGGV